MPYAIAAGGVGDFFGAAIANACRFNDDDLAHLERTPALGDSRRVWTFASWVKLGNDKTHYLMTAGSDGNNYTGFRIESGGQLRYVHLDAASITHDVITTARLRDPAGWYHIVCAVDTTQGTAANRVRLYVNGAEWTDMATANYPSASFDTDINAAVEHNVANYIDNAGHFDGYLAETIFVDNQQLTPDSFGQINPVTGQWVPKAYGGTFGANGFHLDFANASDLGNDVSGNANDYTQNGLVTNDQVPDTPTDNACTLSPVDVSSSGVVLSEGNLVAVVTASSHSPRAKGTWSLTSGKWYWEFKPTNIASLSWLGIARPGEDTDASSIGLNEWVYIDDGTLGNNAGTSAYGAPYTTANVIGVKLDMDAGTLEFLKDNVSQTQAISGLTGAYTPIIGTSGVSDTCTAEIITGHGATALTYAVPADYKTLAARNLTDPDIVRGDGYFAAKTRSGTGGAGSVAGLRFQPDLVWNKSRDEGAVSYTGDHKIWDALRGVTKSLESNTPDQEATEASGLTAFNADGFDFGALAQINFSGDLFIDWCWKEGTVPRLDIVQYSGNNTANRNISHSLGVAPAFALVKRLDASEDWFVWHTGLTGDDYFLKLNATAAEANAASPFGTGNWSATQFMIDNDATNNTNASGADNYIAYLFAGVPGFSKFGLYEGNNNANGPFVWCGFRPNLVIAKNIDAAASFSMFDNARSPSNVHTGTLFADTSAAENSDADVDLLSNGFKFRRASTNFNPSSQTVIFAAFAEAPFKYARAR